VYAETQNVLQAIEALSFTVLKQLADIKMDTRVQSIYLNPSRACKSNPETIAVFMGLLECLHFTVGHNLLTSAVKCEISDECPWPNHSHNWTLAKSSIGFVADPSTDISTLEASSYPPLVDYLRRIGFNAHDVSNGRGLPNKLLFETYVYSLKSNITHRSADLRKRGDEPRLRYCVRGRSDVVIANEGAVSMNRQTIQIAIEVKPIGFSVNEGLRESFLQLIGLTLANEIISCCVILTNLAQTHFVLYLDCDDVMRNRFRLVIKQFEAFNQALYEANKPRVCNTKHFGAAATPQPSNADGSDAGEEEDLILSYQNVSIENVE
jgi:hypothetical protein